MAWGAQQWLRVCREATYGVVLPALDGGTAVEGTDFWWVRLDQSNAFTPRKNPEFFTIRSADGGNRAVQTGSAFYQVGGSLNTLLYPTRAALWFAMFMTLSGTPSDLGSYTFDYYDTQRTWRFLGTKAAQAKLSVGNGSADAQKARLAIDLVAQSVDLANPPTFAAPSITNFPSEVPYTFANTAGVVKLNGNVRTKYSSLELTIKNMLAPTRDELATISALYYAGRDISWTLKSQYTSITDRQQYEGTTAQITNQIKFSNGTNTLTIDLKSSNYIRSINDDLPLDNAAYQTLAVDALYDRSATTDASFATT